MKVNRLIPSLQAVHSTTSRILSNAVTKIVVAKKKIIAAQVLFSLLGREENFNNKNVNETKSPNAVTKL
ncbi:hypothetical protein DI487_15420 [Flavobacterium sediminis]|uniref:Uncharacterized protein n=1 Tax=Flavobacterium sediminis TaxID=2201181 RepID=A0A2U8QY63_9FLAO|nr:hypothetical protein DI487_15420 [Flavobacterium sediminis]